MKRILPLTALIILAGVFWYLAAPSSQPSLSVENQVTPTTAEKLDEQTTSPGLDSELARVVEGDMAQNEEEDIEVKPATQVYKDAASALDAVKKAAATYDDVTLEQFTLPDANCTFCEELYGEIRTLISSKDTKPDEKSFYGELLAISGRKGNLEALVEGAKSTTDTTDRDLYLESLELTLGNDEIVNYLSENLTGADSRLEESLVAAMTNQGTKLAAEKLYEQTNKKGDPEGYYGQGIGLGEFVPDDAALPLLREWALKRDQYSHLAVKSMLNSGTVGLRLVVDLLSSSTTPDVDRQMLNEAVEHVSYDEESEALLKQIKDSCKDPVMCEFANKVLDDFQKDLGAAEEEFGNDTAQ